VAEPTETALDPEEAPTNAARMALAAESALAAVSGPVARIRELHAAEPWGHDEPGDSFRASYLGEAGAEGSAADSIVDGSESICELAYGLAEDAGVSAITSRLVDEESEQALADLLADYEAAYQQMQDIEGEVQAAAESNRHG
jgi:hypothetical protein